MNITIKLNHNDAAFIYGIRRYPLVFIFGTVAGYARQYGEDPATAVASEAAKGRPIVWASPESGVLCGDPGYYAAKQAKEATYPRLSVGDTIEIERKKYTIAPDYNQNIKLIPA